MSKNDTNKAVLNELADHKPHNVREIAYNANISVTTVRMATKRLQAQGVNIEVRTMLTANPKGYITYKII